MSKNYSKLGEVDYNMKVIDRLKSMKKISKTKAALLKALVISGNITKFFGINYKLVSIGDQVGIISIAHKVKGSQYSVFWQQAKKIFKDQIQWIGGYQKADLVGWGQAQFLLGYQKVNEVKKGQFQGFGIQLAKNVGKNQEQFIGGVQIADNVKWNQEQGFGGYQKGGEVGAPYAWNGEGIDIYGYCPRPNHQRQGFGGIQIGGEVMENQRQGFGGYQKVDKVGIQSQKIGCQVINKKGKQEQGFGCKRKYDKAA